MPTTTVKMCVDCKENPATQRSDRCNDCKKEKKLVERRMHYEQKERDPKLGTCTCGKPAISRSSRSCKDCLKDRKNARMVALREARRQAKQNHQPPPATKRPESYRKKQELIQATKMANEKRIAVNVRIMTDIERYYTSGKANVARALNWLYFGRDYHPNTTPARILTGNRPI